MRAPTQSRSGRVRTHMSEFGSTVRVETGFVRFIERSAGDAPHLTGGA